MQVLASEPHADQDRNHRRKHRGDLWGVDWAVPRVASKRLYGKVESFLIKKPGVPAEEDFFRIGGNGLAEA